MLFNVIKLSLDITSRSRKYFLDNDPSKKHKYFFNFRTNSYVIFALYLVSCAVNLLKAIERNSPCRAVAELVSCATFIAGDISNGCMPI